jgi:sigma-B regulation protein RsbU (phosphoserine phosphatase)
MALRRTRLLGAQNDAERSQPPGMMRAFYGTLPGRAILVGAAVKLVTALLEAVLGTLPAFLDVVDTVATVALVGGGGVFLFRSLAFASRRLLWRVRRKLIISYIFIGFVPATLIVAFFMLAGVLLFLNFSSYLVQSRMRAIADRAAALASTVALEAQSAAVSELPDLLRRRAATIAREFPGASLAVVPVDRACADAGPAGADPSKPSGGAPDVAGDWLHVDPPVRIPGWIACEGFAGLLAYSSGTVPPASESRPTITIDGSRLTTSGFGSERLFARAVAFPGAPRPGFGVVLDLPVNESVREQLRRETGVALQSVSAVTPEVIVLPGRAGAPPAAPVEGVEGGLPLTSVSVLEYHDWETGRTGNAVATMQVRIVEIFERISAQGFGSRSFGQALLVVLVVIGGLFLVIQFAALVMGLALARSITGSVHQLFAGTERVRQGDFTHKIAVTARDQLGELAESFNSMTASIEDLLRQAAEKKRLEEELRIAHEIQMSLLPQGPLRMPGLSVSALCVPAREVGGDYYDFIPLDDQRVAVIIADVSGKGTSAALYMAELKGIVLSLCRVHTSPRDLLIAANRIISEHLDARSFITMTYAVLDLETRTMTYARAGHTPLIHLPGGRLAARTARILAPDGLVLGLKLDRGEMFERLLEEQTIELEPGDLYLFFTDGITEAMNAGDDCFGEQRLGQLIEEHGHLPSDELRERVLREIAAFVGATPQHDDMTMILLRIEHLGARPLTAATAVVAGRA